MGTNLATTTISRSISVPSPDFSLLAQVQRLLTGERSRDGKRTLIAAPSSDLRVRLVARLGAINRELTPTKHAEIATALKEMFIAFPSLRGSDEGGKTMIAKYAKELEDLPLWAIQTACQRISRGAAEGASLDYAPSLARVRQVALELVEALRAERMAISDVLQGVPISKPQSEANRDYVRRGLERLRDELGAVAARKRHDERAAFQKAGAALASRREAILGAKEKGHGLDRRDEHAPEGAVE